MFGNKQEKDEANEAEQVSYETEEEFMGCIEAALAEAVKLRGFVDELQLYTEEDLPYIIDKTNETMNDLLKILRQENDNE